MAVVVVTQARGTLNTTDFMNDGVHPGNMGHQLIADLVTGYISTVEAGLHNRPLTEGEVALAKQPILPPLILVTTGHVTSPDNNPCPSIR